MDTKSHRVAGATAKPQPKKLVIKFQRSSVLPPNFEEDTWTVLQGAVQAVQRKQPVATSLEQLYRAVEDMCMHKLDASLYQRLQQACRQHVEAGVAVLRSCVASAEPVKFLEQVDALWQDHCTSMLMIRSIFLYLDRTYPTTTSHVKHVFDMGLALLREQLIKSSQVLDRIVEGVLLLVEAERQGEAIARPLVKSQLGMLSSLDLYQPLFQPRFLDATEQYYRLEGQRLVDELVAANYLLHCERRLQEEYERCTMYLEAGTRKPLVAVLERQLIAAHMPQLLCGGFTDMMNIGRVEDVARLYTLAHRIDALRAVQAALEGYIKATVVEMVNRGVVDKEKDKDMVENLLVFQRKLNTLQDKAFQRNPAYLETIKKAMRDAIDTRKNRPAEMMAKYMDAKMKAVNKSASEDELETLIDEVIVLFRYSQGKDVFEKYYKKDLAKRLLFGKSSSIDAEKSMISKLKAITGEGYVQQLSGMFTDMDLSRDYLTAYRNSSHAALRSANSTVETSVSILCKANWPITPLLPAILPEELARAQYEFGSVWENRHGSRKLEWFNSLGTCIVKAQFPRGSKELSVSLFQAIVLQLFNDTTLLTFGDIREQSGIEVKELRRTLQSLACGKHRVLLKLPPGRDVHDTDAFEYNSSFTDKHVRIKINTIQTVETEEEVIKTNEAIQHDRTHNLDAAIVRTLKARKQISFKLLLQEVVNQVRFAFTTNDLKKRIESLIERDFIERDPDDNTAYRYLA